ncbi:hypothetical protein [Flagellimonas lutimaris]|nr:hypothetical protein [Allomuricauda lutimaris]
MQDTIAAIFKLKETGTISNNFKGLTKGSVEIFKIFSILHMESNE